MGAMRPPVDGLGSLFSREASPLPDLPAIVVVDRDTASAAEVLAAVLQRTGRAAVIGERTSGKCIAEKTFRLRDGMSLEIPVSEFIPPDGPPCNQRGIEPTELLEERTLVSDSAIVPILKSILPAGGSRCTPAAPWLVASVLASHNAARQAVGAADLSWSDDLACHARAWAEHLAALADPELPHSPREQRGREGENLWRGTAGFYSYAQMLGFWVEEGHAYRGEPISETNLHAVGHYTQMIWPETREVGCGVSRGRGDDILVCRYSPPGNLFGRGAIPRIGKDSTKGSFTGGGEILR